MTQELQKAANRLREVDPRVRAEEDADNKRGVIRLGVTVALLAALSVVFKVGAPVLVVIAILTMIMLHEFGHFITARWADMKVTDFFVGFGPVLWSIRRGETRYGVRAIPAGGYVRVIGMNNLEEVDPADEDRTYRAKNYWQRLRFAMAGSVMHFVIAYVLMVILLGAVGIAGASTTIEQVIKHRDDGAFAPAYAVGIRPGDKVVALDGHRVSNFDTAANRIHSSVGHDLRVTVERHGQPVDFIVTPVDGRTAADKTAGVPEYGIIGIKAAEQTVRRPFPGALWHSASELKNITVDSTKGLLGLFTKNNIKHYGHQMTQTGPADPQTDGNRLLSPVGLFRIAGHAAKQGTASVLTLLIAINIFVGIFNMLPLPPFDGGHVAVATYEAIVGRIKGRRHMLDMNKMLPVAYAVVVALALLSLSALWLDIVHPFKLG
ncbi:MAG: hypothetical protein QOG90_156 [Actinomycetota bacterium]